MFEMYMGVGALMCPYRPFADAIKTLLLLRLLSMCLLLYEIHQLILIGTFMNTRTDNPSHWLNPQAIETTKAAEAWLGGGGGGGGGGGEGGGGIC